MKRKQPARINLSNPETPKVDFLNLKAFRSDLSDFKDGAMVWVHIETYYRKRTLDQNNTLHWYLQEIADETGMEMEDVKDQMAKKYLITEVRDKNDNIMADPETGEIMTRQKSTSELNTVEFNVYTEKIRLWCNEYLGLTLPEPDPTKNQKRIKFTY